LKKLSGPVKKMPFIYSSFCWVEK